MLQNKSDIVLKDRQRVRPSLRQASKSENSQRCLKHGKVTWFFCQSLMVKSNKQVHHCVYRSSCWLLCKLLDIGKSCCKGTPFSTTFSDSDGISLSCNPGRGLLTEPQVSLGTELTELGKLGTERCQVYIPPQPNWLSWARFCRLCWTQLLMLISHKFDNILCYKITCSRCTTTRYIVGIVLCKVTL